jgi:hypothetical protein
MNLVKIRKEADISRNANAKIINFTSDSARWIEDNMYTSRFIKYLMLNSLLFNVSIDYILGISEFKVLNNNERKYLINKLNIDENTFIFIFRNCPTLKIKSILIFIYVFKYIKWK